MPVQHSVRHADSWSAGVVDVAMEAPDAQRAANCRGKIIPRPTTLGRKSVELDAVLVMMGGMVASIMVHQATRTLSAAGGAGSCATRRQDDLQLFSRAHRVCVF